MTHKSSHIIVSGLRNKVTFSENATPGKLQVWHLAVALLLAGILIGAAF